MDKNAQSALSNVDVTCFRPYSSDSKQMKCPACSVENSDGDNFCISCGGPLRSLQSVPGYPNLAAEVTRLRTELDMLKDAVRAHGIAVSADIDAVPGAPGSIAPPAAVPIASSRQVYGATPD